MDASEERPRIMDARRQVEEARNRSNAGGRMSEAPTKSFAQAPDGVLSAVFALAGYDIGGEIHRGGQGVVYRALQLATRREVAIKVQHGVGGPGEVELARFEREVQILAQLRHPNIVTVHDMGRAAGWTYYVMDFVDGLPLDRYVADKGLDARETMRLMERVAWAVNEAHLRGVIHRDLKPGNILVDTSGEPRVLDFGLAKGPELGQSVTATGQFVGSLPWASPEQVSGDPAALDVRSDVYSLGVMLYRVLAKEFPYEVTGSVHAVISNIRSADPAAPGVDDEIDTIVLKCLRKERERRYQSAGELARDIERLLKGDPIDAKRESAWYVVRKQVRRHRVAVSFLTMLGLTLIASVVIVWTLYLRAEGAAARAKDAERLAHERLRDSRVSEARALRSGLGPGRRVRSLELLRTAVEEAGGASELRAAERTMIRNDAIAAMSLTDAVEELVFPREIGLLSQHLNHDGALRAVGFRDGAVRITSTKDGSAVAEFTPPDASDAVAPSVYAVRFSSTGRYLAAPHGNTSERRLVVWDVTTRKPVIDVPPAEFHGGFQFAPDDAWIAIGAHGGLQRLALPSGEAAGRMELGGSPRLVAFDAKVERAAVTVGDTGIRVVDAATGETRTTIFVGDDVHAVAFSPDGSLLAAALQQGQVRMWETNGWSQVRELVGHQGAAVGIEFDASGESIVSWSWDATTRLWDVDTGTPLLAPLPGHQSVRIGSGGPVLSLHMSSGLYRLERAAEYRRLNEGAERKATIGIAISADGKLVTTGGEAGARGRIIDVQEGRVIGAAPEALGLWWSTPSELLGVNDAGVVRWDASDLSKIGEGEVVYAEKGVQHFAKLGASARAVMQDARERIVTIDLDRGVIDGVWSESLPSCSALKASPDGRWVCADTWRGRVITVWDAQTGQVASEISNDAGGHMRGWFSSDSKWLVVSRGPDFEWHDTSDWTVRKRIDRQDPLERLGGLAAYSPDGSIIAVSGSRTEIWLLDAASLEKVGVLATTDASYKTSMTFSADGRWLLAVDARAVVHTWDLQLIRNELDELGVGW